MLSVDSIIIKRKEIDLITTPIGIFLGHVVYKEGIKIDLAKIKVILDLKSPINPKQIRISLGLYAVYY